MLTGTLREMAHHRRVLSDLTYSICTEISLGAQRRPIETIAIIPVKGDGGVVQKLCVCRVEKSATLATS